MNAIEARKTILDNIRSKNLTIEQAAIMMGYKNREGLYRMLMHPRKMRYEQILLLSSVTGKSIRKLFKIYGLEI